MHCSNWCVRKDISFRPDLWLSPSMDSMRFQFHHSQRTDPARQQVECSPHCPRHRCPVRMPTDTCTVQDTVITQFLRLLNVVALFHSCQFTVKDIHCSSIIFLTMRSAFGHCGKATARFDTSNYWRNAVMYQQETFAPGA